jgi:iron complex outermembrane recepter protein
MIRPLLFPLLAFALFTNSIHAQTTVKGKILNSEHQPIAFATVVLSKAIDSAVVKGIYSEENGAFQFENIAVGNYFIKSVAVGMGTKSTAAFEIKEGQAELKVEDLVFENSTVDLSAVEVSSIRPMVEFKNGTTTLNVDNTALAAGNSAYDILKKAPGVNIDNNNNIAIQGKKGVKVMIDGRMQQLSNEQLATMLKSMSAEGIDKIEIMSNPSSKYDAEGTSGIIQIKTKKAKLIGFNGNANIAASQGFYLGENGGVSLNYKGEKFSVFSSVNAVNRNRHIETSLNRKIGAAPNELIFDQKNIEIQQSKSVDYKIGADWYVSPKTTLGIVYDGGSGVFKSDSQNKTNLSGNNTLGFTHLVSTSNSPDYWANNNLNLNGLHTLDTNGTTLDFSADYTNYLDKANNQYSNRFYDTTNTEVASMNPNIYNNKTNSNIHILTGALNFTKKLTQKLNLETGAKYSNVQTTNTLLFERKDSLSETFYNDTLFSNQFNYTENVAAVYANFQQEIKHGSIQLGLRGENTNAIGHNVTNGAKVVRNYFQLFPNVSLDYGKTDKHKFQLSYARRINRPDYSQLNPFKFYLDQYTLSEGNPYLNPEKSQNASITHVFKQFLYNTISYQRTTDVMQQYTIQDDVTKETKQVTKNITASNNYAYNLYAYLPIKKWLVSELNLTGWYADYEGNIDGKNYKKGKPSWQVNLSNELILPKHFTVEISGQYTSALLWGVFELKDQGSVDLGIKKTFWDGKASLKVGVSDLFYTEKTRVGVYYENQNFSFNQVNDTRRLRVSFSYNFGKTKFKVRDTKSNSDEKSRIKKN